MMPEDVPDDLRQTARKAFNAAYLSGAPICALDAALAAVAPAIAAQEREACARAAQQTGYELENLDERNGAFAAVAAIRTRGEAGDA